MAPEPTGLADGAAVPLDGVLPAAAPVGEAAGDVACAGNGAAVGKSTDPVLGVTAFPAGTAPASGSGVPSTGEAACAVAGAGTALLLIRSAGVAFGIALLAANVPSWMAPTREAA